MMGGNLVLAVIALAVVGLAGAPIRNVSTLGRWLWELGGGDNGEGSGFEGRYSRSAGAGGTGLVDGGLDGLHSTVSIEHEGGNGGNIQSTWWMQSWMK